MKTPEVLLPLSFQFLSCLGSVFSEEGGDFGLIEYASARSSGVLGP